ncbi:hypothetical protein NGM33_20255 [Nocardiopsis dassonvillei]|uniref:hypothetical protein n=1 Tax=Nocardiopsis dassonvillei TaxID=2014 RepID=UPI0020A30848|nr:hypothetical protein [Nocardiopsis dassonvillei]MCP3015664.1 hypothetical protein [Nocardiopsis dassonvillei]
MVLAGKEWLVSSRAARMALSPARLLLLSGIVAVAWLAGGIGVAHGETAPESGGLVDRVLEVGDGTGRTGQAAAEEIRGARLSDATARAASATESLTDTVVPQTAALPAETLDGTGVTAALERTRTGSAANRAVEDTTRAVDETARGAGDLVGGIALRGHDVVESTDRSLRDSSLVGTVSEGLAESTRAVQDRIGGPAGTATPLGLPVLGGADELSPTAPAPKRSASDEDEGSGEEGDGDRTGGVTAVHAPVDPSVWHRVADEGADRAPGDDPGERIRLIAGGGYHQAGADATGAAAPSFPAPGAAGFLTARADHLAPRAQRVALPGDPTLVVRDAADDPSFAPD